AERPLPIEEAKGFERERNSADDTAFARDERRARTPIGDDGRDRRDVVERRVLLKRRANKLLNRRLLERKSQNANAAAGLSGQRRDRTRCAPPLLRDLGRFHRGTSVIPPDRLLPPSATTAASRLRQWPPFVRSRDARDQQRGQKR